ncbi:hypothetical protein [Neobacillus dielmonensis]|uniref:hypothetical protein n=1 Tax=Neobacillus dielmonensis TaxID=1347369 RepID=UPI000693B02D|nr:hypothetical protein [Neobacillus dielmonensis]
MKKVIHNLVISGITVNSIDTVSGIFVGINHANNWTTHRKNNYGFGSLSNSQVSQNVGLVIDNDIIDTPIENHVVTNVDGLQDIQNIDVKEINVNSLDTNAAVSVGENLLNGWSAHSKRNQGTGRAAGISQHSNNTNILIDNDIIDSPINDFLD